MAFGIPQRKVFTLRIYQQKKKKYLRNIKSDSVDLQVYAFSSNSEKAIDKSIIENLIIFNG